MLCLGELAVHVPESGSFGEYARRYIGPGTGYMITWLYWLTWTATLGTEFTAAALLVKEWFPTTSVWAWTLFLVDSSFSLILVQRVYLLNLSFGLLLLKL